MYDRAVIHMTDRARALVKALDSSYKFEILDARVCIANRVVNFQSLGSPHNFTKNLARTQKMSCIDAS